MTTIKSDAEYPMELEQLLKLSPAELTDMGICPTCLDRWCGGALYGDNSDRLLYENADIECFLWAIPARMAICASRPLSTITT